jgi:LL-diaminopimelate aminotransferase
VIPEHSGVYERLPGYPLAGIPEIRRRLLAEGVDLIDLGAGDADLDPPQVAVEALRAAAGVRRMSRYAFQLGLPDFREAVAAWMEHRFGVSVDPFEELVPLIGSKEGLAHLPFAYMDHADVAVMPDPGYAVYQGGVILAGGEPHLVPLRPENDFLVPLEELPTYVVERTRIIYLNYPNNPTAAWASRDYLQGAVDFCRGIGAILLHDNAYSEIAFDGYRPPSILEMDGAMDVAVEFHSFSKTYNMTGWRLAWAAGNRRVIAALSRVKSFTDTGAFLAVQAAGAAALGSYEEWVPQNVARFQSRRDAAVEALTAAGFTLSAPRATPYLWLPVPGAEPAAAFTKRALEQEGVIVLPGSALGAGGEGFFRIALTAREERLAEAAARLGRVRRGVVG